MSVDELTELATGDQPGRPRPTMIALLALASLAVAIGLLLLTQRDGRALSELRIREANVDVRSGSSDFRQGIEGESLEANDAVRTDITGQAQIDFFDESLTRLDSDSTVVLRGLKDATPGGVLLTLEAGRSWNRVEPAENSEDRYEVRGVTGVAAALGTTFVSDCRQAPTCYYLGIEGETEVTSSEDQSLVIGPEECVRVEEDLLRSCTDHEFDALMDDWVDENVAFDGGQIIDTDFDPASPSPSLSPSPTSGPPRSNLTPRRRVTPRPPTPSPTPTRRPRPTRTPEPPTPSPTRSPSPPPTASPSPSPPPTASPPPSPSPVPP